MNVTDLAFMAAATLINTPSEKQESRLAEIMKYGFALHDYEPLSQTHFIVESEKGVPLSLPTWLKNLDPIKSISLGLQTTSSTLPPHIAAAFEADPNKAVLRVQTECADLRYRCVHKINSWQDVHFKISESYPFNEVPFDLINEISIFDTSLKQIINFCEKTSFPFINIMSSTRQILNDEWVEGNFDRPHIEKLITKFQLKSADAKIIFKRGPIFKALGTSPLVTQVSMAIQFADVFWNMAPWSEHCFNSIADQEEHSNLSERLLSSMNRLKLAVMTEHIRTLRDKVA